MPAPISETSLCSCEVLRDVWFSVNLCACACVHQHVVLCVVGTCLCVVCIYNLCVGVFCGEERIDLEVACPSSRTCTHTHSMYEMCVVDRLCCDLITLETVPYYPNVIQTIAGA